MTAAVPDAGQVAAVYLREAIEQAKLAYQLSPNSYTFGSLSACLAAQDALVVLRGHLEELTDQIESMAG